MAANNAYLVVLTFGVPKVSSLDTNLFENLLTNSLSLVVRLKENGPILSPSRFYPELGDPYLGWEGWDRMG